MKQPGSCIKVFGVSQAFGVFVLAALFSVSEAAKVQKARVAGSHAHHKKLRQDKMQDGKNAEEQAPSFVLQNASQQACVYDIYDGYPDDPDGKWRRCGLSFGASDTTSAMCDTATGDGRLYVSESQIEVRCNLDSTCAGWGFCTDDGGYYRLVTNIPNARRTPAETWTTHVKTCQPCVEQVIVSGAQSVDPNYMGVYRKTSIQPTSLQASKPIFQNDAGNILFYWASSQRWQIGTQGSHDDNTATHLYALANTHCPEAPASWKVFDGSTWSSDYAVAVDEACTESIVVSGAGSPQPAYMGVYVRTNVIPETFHFNRPIYESTAGKVLYYWGERGRWEFGGAHDYSNNNNVHIYAVQNASCPTAVSSWKVYDGVSWSSQYTVSVVDGGTTTTTTTTTTVATTAATIAATEAAATTVAPASETPLSDTGFAAEAHTAAVAAAPPIQRRHEVSSWFIKDDEDDVDDHDGIELDEEQWHSADEKVDEETASKANTVRK